MGLIEEIARFARIPLRFLGPVPNIESGPGKGLRFDGGSASHLFSSGRYELPVQEVLGSMLSPGNVFCDIGANAGFFSILASRLVGPSGRVFALEPVPRNASMVEKNARLNHMTNIEVLRMAASERSGPSELLLAEYAGGAVLKGAGSPPDLAGSLTVDTSTIDDLVTHKKMRPPDAVKIDVEGAELAVLRGMVETLRKWAPRLIVEVDDAEQGKCEEKLWACCAFLKDLHYDSEVLENSYRDGNWFVRHFVALPNAHLRPQPEFDRVNTLP